MTRRNLSKIKGISEAKVEKIKEAAGTIIVSKFVCLLFLGGMGINLSSNPGLFPRLFKQRLETSLFILLPVPNKLMMC